MDRVGLGDTGERIARVRAASITHHLAEPIHFGDWVMTFREFVLIRVDADNGQSGYAYCLTRNGPVAEIVRRSVAPVYEGQPVHHPSDLFYKALWGSHAVFAAGVGMRALSVVDLALWDLSCKLRGESIAQRLGGALAPLPATAIVGYPPSIAPEQTAEQIEELLARGWRRFKIPIAPTLDDTVTRLEAAREAAPDSWIGVDINFRFHAVAEVLDFERRVRSLNLGWIEDFLPPGNAAQVAEVRQGSQTPLAMGDDQGGSYYPEALLRANAVDVVRVDATTMGGLTRFKEVVDSIQQAGLVPSPHMFPHIHSRVLSALGFQAPIEWGIPGTGVHPMDDSLEQPVVVDGLMQPLSEELGLGTLVDPEWIDAQQVADPDRALAD